MNKIEQQLCEAIDDQPNFMSGHKPYVKKAFTDTLRETDSLLGTDDRAIDIVNGAHGVPDEFHPDTYFDIVESLDDSIRDERLREHVEHALDEYALENEMGRDVGGRIHEAMSMYEHRFTPVMGSTFLTDRALDDDAVFRIEQAGRQFAQKTGLGLNDIQSVPDGHSNKHGLDRFFDTFQDFGSERGYQFFDDRRRHKTNSDFYENFGRVVGEAVGACADSHDTYYYESLNVGGRLFGYGVFREMIEGNEPDARSILRPDGLELVALEINRRNDLRINTLDPLDSFQNLLDEVDLNQRFRDGSTPLIFATRQGDEPVVRLLLDHGADPSMPDSDGQKPQDYAWENNRELYETLTSSSSPNKSDDERMGM